MSSSTEVLRIIDQISRIYKDNWAWADLSGMLNEIDQEMANTQLPLFNNSIHRIALHLLATDKLVIKRLQGVNYELKEEEDWVPEQQLQQMDWGDTRKTLLERQHELSDLLHDVSEEDLGHPILKDHSTMYVTLHGYIQHYFYHFGQISQIRNAVLINRTKHLL